MSIRWIHKHFMKLWTIFWTRKNVLYQHTFFEINKQNLKFANTFSFWRCTFAKSWFFWIDDFFILNFVNIFGPFHEHFLNSQTFVQIHEYFLISFFIQNHEQVFNSRILNTRTFLDFLDILIFKNMNIVLICKSFFESTNILLFLFLYWEFIIFWNLKLFKEEKRKNKS